MVKIINAVEEIVTFNIEYKDITLEDMFIELEISKMNVGAVLINGIPKKLTEKIIDNSTIYILPVLSGG